ncbi:MAG: hypothetical protein ACYTGU_18455 [Planctomycetota bacterium]|jgi:hypothetical protein
MRQLGFLGLALGLLIGCSGGDGVFATQRILSRPDTDARAAVAGVAVEVPAARLRGSTLQQNAPGAIVVGSLAEAAEGATPLAGATVSIFSRPEGDLEATVTTGADGSFRIENLEIVHASLELRRDPAAAPDFTLLLTLVRGETIVAGAAHPVGRQAAIDAVLPEVPEGASVVCSQNPLPAGTFVFPAFADREGEGPTLDETHTVADAGEWLLYVDPTPHTAFGHDVKHYLVDAQTGEVTERDALSWPSVNFLPIWFYDGDLFTYGGYHPVRLLEDGSFPEDMELGVSEDIVAFPEEPPPDPEAEALSAGPDALLAQTAGINPDDFFAVFWVGSPETMFIFDLLAMRTWARNAGLRADHQKTILYAEDPLAPDTIPGVTLISSDGSRVEMVEATCAPLEELAAKVQARRDAGGDPLLFVFATSHGSPDGEFLVVDSVLGAVFRKAVSLSGDSVQKYIEAEVILPIQKIPACRVRVALSTCYGKNHIARWFKHYAAMNPPPDVQFYSASGRQVSTGHGIWAAIWRGFPLDLNEEIGKVGLRFSREWTSGGATFAADGDMDFSEAFDSTFGRLSTRQELDNVVIPKESNDRICFDPGFPNPCEPSEPEPEPEPGLITFSADDTALTRFHRVGVDPCPQELYTVTIRNTSDEPVDVVVTGGNHLTVTGAATLAPGEETTITVLFDCSTQEQFTSPVRINATGLSTGETVSREIDVTVMFP